MFGRKTITKHLNMVKPNTQTNNTTTTTTTGAGQPITERKVSFCERSLPSQNAPFLQYDIPNTGGRKSSFVITSVREKNGFDSDDSDDDMVISNAVNPQTFRSREKVPCNNSAAPTGILKSSSATTVNDANGRKAQVKEKRFRNDYSPGLAAVIEQAKVTEIGGKIDKAMDLAKVHLLYAVRSEIKQLKNQIQELDSEMTRLKMENEYLRRHVPLIVLTRLKNVTNVRGVAKVKPSQ